MKYKHFFFDLDGTLCESRESIKLDQGMALALLQRMGADTIVISGAEKERIQKQLGELEVSYIMAQCGSDTPFWKKKLSERDEIEVWRHITKIQKKLKEYDWGKGVEDERFVENRGSQITFSLTGFDCDPKLKKDFDPDTRRRQIILKEIPFFSLNLECKVAGTTSLDYNHKEYTKGKNIKRFIDHLGWKRDECIYFGDRFFPGGNDETVMGVIDCVVVDNPKDFLEKLQKYTN